MIRINRLFILLPFFVYLLLACKSTKPLVQKEITLEISKFDTIPAIVNECSGMVKMDNSLLAINDGGSGPFLYRLNQFGNDTLSVIPINDALNNDWEAITAYADEILVGDFGNNLGMRKDLCIYHLNAENFEVNQKVFFEYPEQKTFDNRAHNFDCEGMVVIENQYVLFTKNRGNSNSNIYMADLHSNEFRMVDTISVPGQVTDAVFHKKSNTVILLCYKFSLGGFRNFVTVVEVLNDKQFRTLKYFELDFNEQFESITHLESNEFLIGSEDGLIKGGNLYKVLLKGL